MREDFRQIFKNLHCSTGSPSDMFYFLTQFEQQSLTQKEEEMDMRVCKFLLEGQDCDLIFDLR